MLRSSIVQQAVEIRTPSGTQTGMPYQGTQTGSMLPTWRARRAVWSGRGICRNHDTDTADPSHDDHDLTDCHGFG